MSITQVSAFTTLASIVVASANASLVSSVASDDMFEVGSFAEMRYRLDKDNSPAWKHGIITNSRNMWSSQNKFGGHSRRPLFDSGVTYNWEVSYTAGSDAVTMATWLGDTLVEAVSWTAPTDNADDVLRAFRIDSSAAGGARVYADVTGYALNGDAVDLVGFYEVSNDFRWSESTRRYMQGGSYVVLDTNLADGDTFALSGTFNMEYEGANWKGLKDERTGMFVRLYGGEALPVSEIPAPGAAALVGAAGLFAARRRRR